MKKINDANWVHYCTDEILDGDKPTGYVEIFNDCIEFIDELSFPERKLIEPLILNIAEGDGWLRLRIDVDTYAEGDILVSQLNDLEEEYRCSSIGNWYLGDARENYID